MKGQRVHLGFDVAGAAVEIPLRHMAVTGQTQEAGKTTALEALVERGQLRAVTFITKRGEGTFGKARRIAPYFREQTDWQYVASILEASRGERLKFERAWIIRASKGARTLADVQANVRKAMETAKGLSADVYLTLDAYLDQVVPAIAAVKWAPALELRPGVNAIDLSGVSVEMQHLVIRSTLNWVLEREEHTVVVVPEAWKFIPQGRGTPVQLAAESFVRQGAALGNYLWLDSQDIGGVEKTILRSCVVWLLGVQREANELKRTLDNIPAGVAKPKAADVARLGLGEFFACWGAHVVKTYVQPAWMDAAAARGVAIGKVPADVVDRARREGPVLNRLQEEPEMCAQHQQLAAEVAELKRQLEEANAIAAEGERIGKELTRQEAAIRDFQNAFLRLLPGGLSGEAASIELTAQPAVDEDALVARVLARIPASGGGPVTVTPPEKLRLDFQREEAARILELARGLDVLGRQMLKLLEGIEGKYLSQNAIAERLGRSNSGGAMQALRDQVKFLTEHGLIAVDGKKGVRSSVRAKIAADLDTYQPAAADVEAVYQNVLHSLATAS